MTRTGLSPRLAAHLPEPFVEVHPDDAATAGLADGGFARVSTAHGACVVKVVVSDAQRPGSLFMPIHWSAQTSSSARVGDLVAPRTDPHSGQPEAKATPAAIAPVLFSRRGIARTRHALDPRALPEGTWWTRVAIAQGSEYRLATDCGPMLWHDFAYRMLAPDAKLAEEVDGAVYRAAAFVDDHLEGSFCVGPADTPLQWDARALALAESADSGPPRTAAIGAADNYIETEPVICACFQVSVAVVHDAVVRGKVRTVEEIGQTLRAGTNCGSCLPELKRIIAHERIAHSD
jgi:assimilatory nitrate reductase catalytic subunit